MRTLTLRKETLVALSDADLGAVVAGISPLTEGCLSRICYTDPCIEPPYTWFPTQGCA